MTSAIIPDNAFLFDTQSIVAGDRDADVARSASFEPWDARPALLQADLKAELLAAGLDDAKKLDPRVSVLVIAAFSTGLWAAAAAVGRWIVG